MTLQQINAQNTKLWQDISDIVAVINIIASK